jgi:alpha-glucosidase
VWNLGGERAVTPAEQGHLESNRSNIRLRAQLEPFYYSLLHLAHEKGEPVISPMAYYYQNLPQFRDMGNQAMIGRDLMMAVVASRFENKRDVQLPKGKWFDFHYGNSYDGRQNGWLIRNYGTWGKMEGEATDVLRVPLFARAGSIIPMDRLNGEGRRTGDLRVRVFGDAKTSYFTLAEDDGHSLGYKRNEILRTKISQKVTDAEGQVTIDPVEGNRYQGAPDFRNNYVELVLDSGQPKSAHLDGVGDLPHADSLEKLSQMESGYYWDAGLHRVTLKSPVMSIDARKTFTVRK